MVLALVALFATGVLGGGIGGSSSGDYRLIGDGIRVDLPAPVNDEPAVEWSARSAGFAQSAVQVGNVIAVLSSDGDRAELAGLDASSGEERWVARLGRGFGSQVLASDVLVVSVGGQDGARLLGIDPRNGEEVWEEELRTMFGDVFMQTDNNGRIIVQTFDGGSGDEILRLDPRDGETTRLARGSGLRLTPAGILEVRDGRITGMSSDDGERLFRFNARELRDVGQFGFPAVTARDGVVYLAVEDDLAAYDTDGERLWSERTDIGSAFSVSVTDRGHVLVAGSDGTELRDGDGGLLWDDRDPIFAAGRFGGVELGVSFRNDDLDYVDLATGDRPGRRVRIEFQGGDGDSFFYAADTVYVPDFERDEIVAHRLPSGERLWSADAQGRFLGNVFPLDRALLVVTDDDEVTLLR
ncbi:hypothetical protein BH23ACT9_BH23ACT9_28250 [soil metagenome]